MIKDKLSYKEMSEMFFADFAKGITDTPDGLKKAVKEVGKYVTELPAETVLEFEDIIKACMRVVFNAPEDNLKDDNIFMENTACHEAGHAVVAEVLEPGSVSLVSICSYIGEVGGVTSYYQNENYWQSKKYPKMRHHRHF